MPADYLLVSMSRTARGACPAADITSPEHATATMMETALGAERDSMHSPEHVAIVARLTTKSS